MEEISFRTSMTVLAGVVAFAAVLAAVSVLMSLPPGAARHTAAGGPARTPPASAVPGPGTRTLASPAASPAQPTPSPLRVAPPAARTAAPVTAAMPSPAVPTTPARSPSLARFSYQSAVAAWWAWWTRVHGGGIWRPGGSRGYGGGYRGFGRGGGWAGRR